jgi:hypothetical protein
MFLQRVFRSAELFATGAMLLLALTSVGLCQNAPVQEVVQVVTTNTAFALSRRTAMALQLPGRQMGNR